MTAAADRLQDGIFWRSTQRPPACLRLVLFDIAPNTRPADARDAIARLTTVLDELRHGEVRDLAGQPPRTRAETAAQFVDLTVLLAFGRRLFDSGAHDPPLTAAPRPPYLARLDDQTQAFPTLPWADDNAGRNRGEADLLVQLTADNEAAVNAAAVELWKLIPDERLPLKLTASFAGFGRPDGRGWLDFHDGVSNLQTDDRPAAIVASGEPAWMAGGTYLAFLRLGIDLTAWRSLPRPQQELLVGRDKLTGAPLTGARRTPDGGVEPIAAPSPAEVGAALGPEHIDPPQVTDPLIEASHVHRANQNRASASAPGGLRMFRQGYDFIDDLGPDGPTLGLTFISFQRDLAVVQHLLHLPGWLGDVNFGGRHDRGPGEPPPERFISLAAGGLYAVPPRARPFPGVTLFEPTATPRVPCVDKIE